MSSTHSLKPDNSNCLFEKFQRLKSSIVTFTKYCCDTLKAQNNSYRSRAIKTRNKRHKQNLQQGEISPQLRWHHKVSQVIYRDREVTDDIYWTGVALPLLETIKLHTFCATFVLVMDYRHTFHHQSLRTAASSRSYFWICISFYLHLRSFTFGQNEQTKHSSSCISETNPQWLS